MKLLKEFTAMLCGSFDNSVQLERFAAQGITGYPEAHHVNTRINDHIDHLPEDFAGEFVLEESYYTVGGRTNAMPHLFLFTEEGDCVKLTSYEMPEGYTKDTFTASGLGRLDYPDPPALRHLHPCPLPQERRVVRRRQREHVYTGTEI